MSEEELCKCGKPLRHRGRCRPIATPLRVPANHSTSVEFVRKTKPRPNLSRNGALDELLAELNAEKVKIDAAIAALRDLYGLEG